MTELNTLKRKSPADLWKEDLAAFSEELEVAALLALSLASGYIPSVKLIPLG